MAPNAEESKCGGFKLIGFNFRGEPRELPLSLFTLGQLSFFIVFCDSATLLFLYP